MRVPCLKCGVATIDYMPCTQCGCRSHMRLSLTLRDAAFFSEKKSLKGLINEALEDDYMHEPLVDPLEDVNGLGLGDILWGDRS